MKRMAECRRDNLREGRTLRTGRIGGGSRIELQSRVADARDMAEFVNRSTLLRHY
jgi:hypothetical protein